MGIDLLRQPDDTQDATDEAKLVSILVEVFHRFVVFHPSLRRPEADCLALWVLHTWCFDAAESTPYVSIEGPTMRSGKSRVIDVARHLVARPFVVIDPTPSSLFRKIDADQPTVFVDEVDRLQRSKELQAVLNGGYHRGGAVTRSVKVGDSWVPQDFNVFCPKLFAGITGVRSPLQGTVLDRCIRIPLHRRKQSEHVEKFYHSDFRAAAEPLRRAAALFADRHVPTLTRMRPAMPEELNDRAEEVSMPLVAIADIARGEWPDRAREALVALFGAVDEEPDEGIQVLRDLKRVWEQIDGEKAHTRVLASKRNALEDAEYKGVLTEQELALRLKRFGIKPERSPIRLADESRRGYRRSSFFDAWERYT